MCAIIRKHAEQVEAITRRLLADTGDSADPRDWVACLVRPLPEHLAALGSPTWYARFCAQVMVDPALREIMVEEFLTSAAVQQVVEGLSRRLPDMPPDVRAERGTMARHLILHTCAERERALADDPEAPWPGWHRIAAGLTDAVVGMWLAPVTPVP